MEQFRQIGEVLGSLKAQMIFHDETKINSRQCALLFDVFTLAFDSIAEEMKKCLRFDERHTKWKALEHPLKELCRIFREGEQFVRNCLEPKDSWWGKAIALNQSADCVEFYVHNLLWCVPVVVEAIESASEISGTDQDKMEKKRIMFSKKYDRDWMDRTLFQHKFGSLYLVSPQLCRRFDSVVREDKWLLSEAVSEKKSSQLLSKQENRLCELLLGAKGNIFPCSVLTGSPDYQVRRRLGGTGTNYKEIQWMGENFTMKHAIGDGEVELLTSQVALQSSLAHPNVMNYMYAFCDEEKRECFLVMELMSKDLASYVKEVTCPRKRIPFPLLVAVDVMLQIARGMEYLHSKNICHGDLNPSNVLVKARSSSPDSYLQVKLTNFGLSASKSPKVSATGNPCIWYAPEVLTEQDQSSGNSTNGCKYTEKADVYSFAMICFELLTEKVPFEDSHLQGDKMSRNIRAGERPLFPFPSLKHLASLTKRCWQTEPMQRPSFSSIARALRYIKRFLVMNPDHGQAEVLNQSVDYFDIETNLSKRLMNWGKKEGSKVSDIPFQMYAYRVIERERTNANFVKEKSLDSGGDGASFYRHENGSHGNALSEDSLSNSVGSVTSSSNGGSEGSKKGSLAKKVDGKAKKQTGQQQQQKAKTVRPQQLAASCARSFKMNSDGHLQPVVMNPEGRRRTSTSDSELP